MSDVPPLWLCYFKDAFCHGFGEDQLSFIQLQEVTYLNNANNLEIIDQCCLFS